MMSPTLRTVLYTLVVLGIFLGYLPWQVLRLDAAIGDSLQAFLFYLSLVFFFTGAALLFSGIYYLVLRGDGTPLPFDPPKRMVVAGPYSWVQHPMMLGLLLLVFAEAFWFYSVSLSVYAVLLMLLANLYLTYIEEPQAERRFGEDYRAYRNTVPRWLPMLSRTKQIKN